MLPKHKRSAPAGFTLVELIIVVAILALLTAILLPAINSARAAARNTAVRAQISSIDAACRKYEQDFDSFPGILPRVTADNNGILRNWTKLSDTEGLVLSLLGGVWRDDALPVSSPQRLSRVITVSDIGPSGYYVEGSNGRRTAGGYNFSRRLVGQGPLAGKSTAPNLTQYNAYLSEVNLVDFDDVNPADVRFGFPEIADVATGLPILYFRANKGRPKMSPPASETDPEKDFGQYNYFVSAKYYQPTTYVRPQDADYTPLAANKSWFANDTSGRERWQKFIRDNKSSTGSTSESVPNRRDEFILHSAGADGVFGAENMDLTFDDIANWER